MCDLAAVLLSLGEGTWIGRRTIEAPSVPTDRAAVNSGTTRVVLGEPPGATIGIGKRAGWANVDAIRLPRRQHLTAENEEPSNGARSRHFSYDARHVSLLSALLAAHASAN